MTTHIPPSGAYRKLFKLAMDDLIISGKLNDADLADAMAYRAMLNDQDYKFGRLNMAGGSHRVWAPGELFLRS